MFDWTPSRLAASVALQQPATHRHGPCCRDVDVRKVLDLCTGSGIAALHALRCGAKEVASGSGKFSLGKLSSGHSC